MRLRHLCLPALGLLLAATFTARPASAGVLEAIVTDDGGKPVADAVVYAVPRTGQAPRAEIKGRVVMDQRDREFVPYVLPVQVGTPVYFPNSDNIRHHVYSFSPAKKFELPLYKGTPAEPVVFDKTGPVALGCNIHDWMVGYIYVVDTPWFGTTDGDGDTHLNLPAGEYEVRVWHTRMKEPVETTLRPITVAGERETRIEFSIGLNPDTRKQRPRSYYGPAYHY